MQQQQQNTLSLRASTATILVWAQPATKRLVRHSQTVQLIKKKKKHQKKSNDSKPYFPFPRTQPHLYNTNHYTFFSGEGKLIKIAKNVAATEMHKLWKQAEYYGALDF
jgi:hypothetical protein